MASLADKNSQTIAAAFARLRQSSEDVFRRGMEQVMEYAVQYALDAHDEFHQNHLKHGGTYGWVVFHDGIEVSRSVRGTGDGDVTERLGAVPHWSKGWCGIVMAGMTPVEYFATNVEFLLLRKTINDMKTNGVSRYFTKVR